MGSFQFEWWDVKVKETTGVNTWEIKAKDRDGAIRQINRQAAKMNDETKPVWQTGGRVIEIYWDTLAIDRKGYQRRF